MMLFGGLGFGPAHPDGSCLIRYLNDLYADFVKLDIRSGANAGFDLPGVYGTRNIFHPTNWPGSRCQASAWADDVGNGYLYGGYGYAINNSTRGDLGDLWLYSPSLDAFAWIGGPAAPNVPESRGAYGEVSPDYYPSCRRAAVVWRAPLSVVFWLFGKMLAGTMPRG